MQPLTIIGQHGKWCSGQIVKMGTTDTSAKTQDLFLQPPRY